ncbi:unnamed protein product [Durusdinium trenchii]|uniref:Transmembrane protein n=1 Tax=Durusdinium trenchii TaxID=1381693 RepID=A0ABP0MJ15_9DINO
MDNQRLVSGTRFGDLHPDTIGAQPEQKERENVEELQFKVATYVARMEILTPEALRVTCAHQALRCCGRALRPLDDDLFGESVVSETISCFWSHSWHGRHWMKSFSLMMRYNGLSSVLLGSFSALVMTVFFSCGVLPGIPRGFGETYREHWSAWSLPAGFVTAAITFVLWRPKQLVFLDRICINEHDTDLKLASIYSLAGILKKSDQMLVLWDSTWSDRLWCLFELAAFLKSKTVREQELLITPTFLGPCSIALFVGVFIVMLPVTTVPMPSIAGVGGVGPYFVLVPLSGAVLFLLVSGYFIAAAFRAYFRSVQTMKTKLLQISCDHAKCACCDLNHVYEGVRIMCDREIVKECISIWFGSEEAFEDYARSEVLEKLLGRLHDQIFTRQWSLSVSIPLLWAFLDLTVSHARANNTYAAVAQLVEGVVLWFLCAPIFTDLCTFVAWRSCRKATSKIREMLENLKVELVGVLCFSVMAGSWFISQAPYYQDRLYDAAAFGGVWSLVALFHYLYKVSRRSYLSRGFRA